MDELDDFFSDISKVAANTTEESQEPVVKKTKVEATIVATPQGAYNFILCSSFFPLFTCYIK
jgi:hypothetical protein